MLPKSVSRLREKDPGRDSRVRRQVLGVFVLSAGVLLATARSEATSPTTKAPGGPAPVPAKKTTVAPSDFAVVKAAVEKYFASIEGYQNGDLIRQSQVEQALAAVHEVGWDVPGSDAILKRALADGSFLVRELSTPAGRTFMRRVARHTGTYSRLERLSTIAGGEQLVRNLVHQKDGDKLVQYLATTPGGHNMGRMAAKTKHGVDLNKSTGRIYTAADLVAELEKVHRSLGSKSSQIEDRPRRIAN